MFLLLACADEGCATDPVDDDDAPLPVVATKAPLAMPDDPLAGTSVESCAVYEEERCVAGALERCAVYDTAEADWVDEVDPMLRRVFLFERWRERLPFRLQFHLRSPPCFFVRFLLTLLTGLLECLIRLCLSL